jgi:hypothetical protein
VQRGWEFLDGTERADVERRLAKVLAVHRWGTHNRDALLHFFNFLAQVETIAIEIPFKASWKTPDSMHPTLRRQLVDEVFHSLLFSRLAHELALPASQPPPPLASAQRMLDRIRDEPDMAVGGTLLNLVAEGWIETLFKHALSWHVADAVFEAVLADESRHVQEATQYVGGLDRAAAERAVRDLEEGLAQVSSEPTVALAIADLAGAAGARQLRIDLDRTHAEHLAQVGLLPHPRWVELMGPTPVDAAGDEAGEAVHVVRDTPWRRAARDVWTTPRDPTMQGSFDVAVGHIPRKLLTPVFVAAVGRAWAKNPRLNRLVSRGRVWELPHANVGVRVMVAEDELSTLVVPQADRRSVPDIQRILADGMEQLQAMKRLRPAGDVPAPGAAAALDLVAPDPQSFAVSLSNTGKFGIQTGAGAFTGPVAPGTDLTLGQRRRLPVWRGVAYVPAWHVSVGCLQDHRLFDGREAGLAMNAVRAELTRTAVRRLLRSPDTIPTHVNRPAYDEAWYASLPAPIRTLSAVGFHKGWPTVVPYIVGGAATLGAVAAAAAHSITADKDGPVPEVDYEDSPKPGGPRGK